MTSSLSKLSQFWFPEVSARGFGIARILFFGLGFIHFARMDLSGLSSIQPSFWYPFSFFHFLPVPTLSGPTIATASLIWKGALLSATLGFGTRWSMLLAATLTTLLLGLRSGFGWPLHNHTIYIVCMWVILFSDSAKSLSVDAYLRKSTIDTTTVPGWPIQLIRSLIVMAYLTSGISKLRDTGLDWASSENLSWYLEYAHQMYQGSIKFSFQPKLNFWLRMQPTIMDIAAKLVLALELSAPLALVSHLARLILLPGLLFMHLGVFIFMYLDWTPMLICLLFWLPWIQKDSTNGNGP